MPVFVGDNYVGPQFTQFADRIPGDMDVDPFVKQGMTLRATEGPRALHADVQRVPLRRSTPCNP